MKSARTTASELLWERGNPAPIKAFRQAEKASGCDDFAKANFRMEIAAEASQLVICDQAPSAGAALPRFGGKLARGMPRKRFELRGR